jgi:hypothetical protein
MKTATLSVSLFLLGVVGPGLRAQDKGAFEPLDVFRLEFAADPQISPDGKRVIYVRNFMDIKKDQVHSYRCVLDRPSIGMG